MLKEFLVGDTLQITWVNTGTVPSSGAYEIFDGSETLVGSGALVGSEYSVGSADHMYAMYTVPNTPGYYVSKTIAYIDGNPYKRAEIFKVIELEAD